MSGRGRFFRPRLAFSAGRTPPPADRAGEQNFREVMLPHMDAAYNFARYLACDPTAAEDIVQAAFLRAFRSFGSFRGEAPKAWLFAIVRNCFLDSVKGARDTVGLEEAGEQGGGGEAGGVDHDTPEAILARKRDAQRLRDTIESLPEPFREAIVLRELEELSYREIAMIAGVPIGTVMSRLARARQMLCELLVPAGDQGRRAAR
jgi:RNA polymerase sigma factor (sigma-70 family)